MLIIPFGVHSLENPRTHTYTHLSVPSGCLLNRDGAEDNVRLTVCKDGEGEPERLDQHMRKKHFHH